MKVSGSKRVIAWAAAVVLLAAGGCTNSQVIGTSTGGIRVTVEARGGAGRYDLGNLIISQISLQPTDPDAQGSLGAPFGLLLNPIELDLNNPAVVSVRIGAPAGVEAALSEGTYEVVGATVLLFTLADEPPAMHGLTCVQRVDVLALPPNVSQDSLTRVEFQVRPVFEISATRTAELRLIVDVPGVVSVFENGFFGCKLTGTCFTNNVSTVAPCVDKYRSPASSALEPYLVFQQQ